MAKSVIYFHYIYELDSKFNLGDVAGKENQGTSISNVFEPP